MDILASLNPQQRLAVEHGTGPALVLAGAGSGKTRVIAHRVAYLIQNAASRPEHILAVTFTNKAAKEMRERVQTLMGPARTSEPLVTTFHSLCVRLLRREIHKLGYKRDFSIYDTDDQRRLIKQILQDLHILEKDLSPREILGRISHAKNHNTSPEHYAERFPSRVADDIAEIYGVYNDRLLKANSLDFDDLLLKAVALLEKHPQERNYYSDWYRYILVDEYQDTNRPQYELLRFLTATHENLFAVGDEDQSIYKFRGADIQNILRFEKDFPGTKIIKLEQNYRSTQNILRVAGAVVENNTERKGKALWTENGGGDIVTCHRAQSSRSEAIWVSRRIRALLSDDPDYRVGVLYRANFLSRNFEDVLTEDGIPYAVVGSVAFFGRMEVKDMLAYLKVILNPEDDVALLRIINTPARGIGTTTIDMLTRLAAEKGEPLTQVLRRLAGDPGTAARAGRALMKFQEMLDRWMAQRDSSTIAELLETIVRDVQYRDMLEKQETTQEAENRISNIDELIRAAAESADRGETAFEFLDRASLSSELDHLDPNARVSLMTLHSAKGLEFDVVFLAGMEEGLFPHSQSMNAPEDLEEERRLCYVGITRARRKLFLTWTPYRRTFGSDSGIASIASRFLKEMPADLIEGLDQNNGYVDDPEAEYTHLDKTKDEDSKFDRKTPWHQKQPEALQEQPKSMAELRAYLAQKPSAPAGKAERERLLMSGMRVRHAQFGDGIVLRRERVGSDVKLIVTFSRVGKKTLLEKYAKLQPL